MSSRRQREVLSPIISTPNIPQRTKGASPYVTPPPRTQSTNSPSTFLMEQQDDELERKARRRSRVMDLQRRNLTSSPSSPAERRKSLPLSGLTAAQLTDHYTSCIKLSAENKINAKNAFGLHLIDFMSELLIKKELENFQVASTTLDASAKIYAGRVDAIHAETYKVLSGLGRSADKQKQADDDDAEHADDGGEGEGEGAEDKQKKKKKTRKSKTIETNLKNINVSKFDLEFEVDPMFKVMSAAFDEGGSSGLLLNNLRSFDNSQQLVLDANTVIETTDDLDTSRIEERKENVDLTAFKESFQRIRLPDIKVCPAFCTFRFTNWDATEQSSMPGLSSSQLDHRFDMEAEPEPIPDTQDNMSVMGAGDDMDNLMDDVADTNYDDDDEETIDKCVGDGKAAQLVQNVLSDMAKGTTGTLMQVLSTEPSDYSYFNKALLRTWAGPDHWRSGNLSKGLQKSTLMQKSKAKQRQIYRIDLEEDIDFDAHFRPSKHTSLTKTTLNKYSKDQTTLPKDHHYDADTLFKLFLMKRKMIRRQTDNPDEDVDDVIENYDYENKNDRENYCPHDDVDDDNDDGDMDFGDFGAKEIEDSQESSSQDPFGQSQDPFTQNFTANESILGDKLLAQPYKVNKIDIDYAKTAKKLDVKRLKSSMWQLLKSAPKGDQEPSMSSETPETENNANNSAVLPGTNTPREMEGKITFQQLLNELPEKVSGQTAKNLSVPIAFVCLLHLANEKTLKIEDLNMEDLLITQGL